MWMQIEMQMRMQIQIQMEMADDVDGRRSRGGQARQAMRGITYEYVTYCTRFGDRSLPAYEYS